MILKLTEDINVVRETIRVDEIKSFRKWNKNVDEEKHIDGDVTIVYLIGDKTKKPAEMKINESYDSFNARLNVTVCKEE